jgi:hypothetical protein
MVTAMSYEPGRKPASVKLPSAPDVAAKLRKAFAA